MRYVFFCFLVANGASGAELDALKAKSELSFLAVGQPSAIKIRGTLGETDALSGKIKFTHDKATGKLTLKLDALDTGIALRTRHMKEKYLETATYPTAELDLNCPFSPEGNKANLTGKLKLHGKTNAVNGTCEASPGKLAVEFKIKLQDYGMATPSYLGITVTDEVTVQAKTEGTAS